MGTARRTIVPWPLTIGGELHVDNTSAAGRLMRLIARIITAPKSAKRAEPSSETQSHA